MSFCRMFKRPAIDGRGVFPCDGDSNQHYMCWVKYCCHVFDEVLFHTLCNKTMCPTIKYVCWLRLKPPKYFMLVLCPRNHSIFSSEWLVTFRSVLDNTHLIISPVVYNFELMLPIPRTCNCLLHWPILTVNEINHDILHYRIEAVDLWTIISHII